MSIPLNRVAPYFEHRDEGKRLLYDLLCAYKLLWYSGNVIKPGTESYRMRIEVEAQIRVMEAALGVAHQPPGRFLGSVPEFADFIL